MFLVMFTRVAIYVIFWVVLVLCVALIFTAAKKEMFDAVYKKK